MMSRNSKPRGRAIRNLRRLSQTLSLLLFVWLLLRTELPRNRWDITNSVPVPADLYFQLDPLALVGSVLTSWKVQAGLLLALITVGATLLLGRVFCGWVCPMGALSQFAGWLWRRTTRKRDWAARQESSPLQRWKYLVLVAFLVGAVVGVNQIGLLDPLSLTYRSFTTAIFPAFGDSVGAGLDALPDAAAQPVRRGFETHLYPIGPQHFAQGAVIGLIFVGIIAAGMALPRMWCRWLCPLGALLGMLSWRQLLRVRVDPDACRECGLCHFTCEGAADPHRPGAWLAHECLMCWNCAPSCPSGGITIGFPKQRLIKEPSLDIGRRRLIGAAALGLVAPPLIRAGVISNRAEPGMIRPPGALPEPRFVSQCIKCGECMRVCPTNFLHPAGLGGGIEALWTPVGNGRRGYCSFECSLCGQVCPTHAIEVLPLEVKKTTKIGLAFVDRSRCLPWAFDTECLVCEEHCPTSPKAIRLRDIEGETRLRAPIIDADQCIGCAHCEHVCPVVDLPAIRVTSIGETRSESNRLQLRERHGGRHRRRRHGREDSASPETTSGRDDPYATAN